MTSRKQLAVVASVVLAAVILLGVGRYFLSDEIAPVGVGANAPGFSVMTLDATPVKKTLADYKGQVVMINIWATWCAPCRVEMPSIEKLHTAYAGKGLKVVAISVDEPGTDSLIREFARDYKLSFEILHDTGGQEGSVSRNYQISGYPETVVIGRDGVIRKKYLGATNWNSPSNRALIERLLAEQAG